MKFTPRSEEDVQKEASKFGPWPNGTYDFEVSDAVEKTSSNGNEMIALTIHVFNEDGDRRTVFDYLLESIPHKLKHAAEACGLFSRYENGTLDGNDFYGKTGRLKLGIQPEKNNYPAKNVVRDYVPARLAQSSQQPSSIPTQRAKVKAPAGDIDDEIPF